MTESALQSVAMIAALALVLGGAWTLAKRRDRGRGMLMLLAALVLIANVLIWAWPLAK